MFVMLISAPIVVLWQKFEVDGSGLNEKSKGQAVGSDCRWSGVSMSRRVFGRM